MPVNEQSKLFSEVHAPIAYHLNSYSEYFVEFPEAVVESIEMINSWESVHGEMYTQSTDIVSDVRYQDLYEKIRKYDRKILSMKLSIK